MRLARQFGGKTLFAAFDPIEPALPKPPCLSGTRDQSASHLKWIAPDNGGADIKYYKIYRGTATGNETFLADTGSDAVPNAKTTFDDTTADPNVPVYYYYVKAVNSVDANGGTASNEIALAVVPVPTPENLCVRPGLTLLTDAAGDDTGGPGADLLSFQLAQPYQSDGIPRLVFTINTDAGIATQPANSFWYVSMKIANGATFRYKAVRMLWLGATPTFQSYTPRASNSGAVDGRFVTAGSEQAAEAGSSYASPYEKVIIIVKASDLGLSPGDTIAGFVSGVSQNAVVVGALLDQMPNSLNYASPYTLVPNGACSAASMLRGAVSRKTHGTATFDVNLPLTGDLGIEPRKGSGAGSDSHQVVFRFYNPATVGSVSATATSPSGPQPVAASGQTNPSDSTEYIVTLSGVPNAQYVTVNLANVSDNAGNSASALTTTMGVLPGDTTANASVNSSDIAQTKSQSGQPVTSANFRTDVTVNGAINSSDIALVKSKSGTALPAP